MTSVRIRTGVRAGALTSALLVLGAVPAGAVTQRPALSPGCTEGTGGRVTCTFTSPTTGDAPIVDVPNRVTEATITVRGGAGGDGATATLFGPPVTSPGGAAGTAVATLTVDPAKDLEVRVGGAGQSGLDGGAGGVGGGAGGAGSSVGLPPIVALLGGGGGGGSEVRVAGTDPASDNPLVAAGGGGGGGSGLFGLIPGPGPGGAGGGASGESAPGIDIGIGEIAGGGEGGTATAGGAGGTLLDGVAGLIEGEAGSRGTGGAAATDILPGLSVGGTGAGGGGGGYFGGGGGSVLSGGGGGSGFGPDGTVFGTGPAPAAPFTESALPDGEVIIEFAAPEPEDDGSSGGAGGEDGDGGGAGGGGDNGGEAGGGGVDPCSDVARITVSDRLPLIPLSC